MKMEPVKSFVADPVRLLRKLSDALRRPELWPPYFKFEFQFADECALGLACELGMIDDPTKADAMQTFGLSSKEAYQIFFAGCWNVEITAPMVADRIDAYLARQAG